MHLAALANEFAETIPDYEFSTAELQGFLLSCKRKPEEAVLKAKLWVTQELLERQQRAANRYTDQQPQLLDTQPAETNLPIPAGVGFPGLGGITPTASTSPSISGIGSAPSGDHIAPPTPPQTPSITPKEPKEGSMMAISPCDG